MCDRWSVGGDFISAFLSSCTATHLQKFFAFSTGSGDSFFDCKKQSDLDSDGSDVCVVAFFLSFVNAARLKDPQGGRKNGKKKHSEDYFTVSEGENGGRRRL